MKKYEIMYILRSELAEEERQAEIDNVNKIVTDLGGTVEAVDTEKFGLREFAYEMNDLRKGFYVIINVLADNKILAEFDRLAKLNNRVIRHIIVAAK